MAIQNYLTLSHLRKAVASITQKINNLKPDWNAKVGEEGYIANRTHWKEEQTVVVAEEQTIAMESNSADIQPADGITEPEFSAGDLLIITLNGTIYEVEAINGEMYPYAELKDATIYSHNLSIDFNAEAEIPESITISIIKKTTTYHQLDSKYVNGLIKAGTGRNSEIFNNENNVASGDYSHAEGSFTTASFSYSHAEGNYTTASGYGSHAEGTSTTASGNYSHAEGSSTTASSVYSHAEGYNTTASGYGSHAEGTSTTASGNYSHAEGSHTTASGGYSHAEGVLTIASGSRSHTEGTGTTASGDYSHAEGYYTTAQRRSQHAIGEYNVLDTSGSSVTTKGAYIEIVGNGTSDIARSNARTLDWNGNEVLAGKLTVGAAPTNNMDVATKQYVDSAVSGASGGSSTLVDLTDTTISSPTNGQFLQYNSTSSKWENKTYTAPVTSVNGQTGAVAVSVPTASSTTPSADGTGAVGTATTYARADHVHPKITQTISISSNVITLTGSDGTTSSVTLPVYNGGVSS